MPVTGSCESGICNRKTRSPT